MMAGDVVADEVEEEVISEDIQSSDANQGTTHDNQNTAGIVCVCVRA